MMNAIKANHLSLKANRKQAVIFALGSISVDWIKHLIRYTVTEG